MDRDYFSNHEFHNELFFGYLWSFVHKFTSSSTNQITLFNNNRFKAESRAECLFMLRYMHSK